MEYRSCQTGSCLWAGGWPTQADQGRYTMVRTVVPKGLELRGQAFAFTTFKVHVAKVRSDLTQNSMLFNVQKRWGFALVAFFKVAFQPLIVAFYSALLITTLACRYAKDGGILTILFLPHLMHTSHVDDKLREPRDGTSTRRRTEPVSVLDELTSFCSS